MNEKERQAIALAKFSVISPVVNGQIVQSGKYFDAISKKPVQMPGGEHIYSNRTFETWLHLYGRFGLDGLMPGFRSDKGKSRKVSDELAVRISELKTQYPKMPVTVLYERLIEEKTLEEGEVSRATIYRYVADSSAFTETTAGEQKESHRFSYQHPGEMWQGDVLYGPKIKTGRSEKQTYLHAFIDDHSRYIVGSGFFFEQNFESMRLCLKDAMLKNGIPKITYTDNGKIYRSQQLTLICASLGCSLLHSQPYVPQGRGKIERFFQTVRMRFLDCLKSLPESLEALNWSYAAWLHDDYQTKVHSALSGKSPKEAFLSGIDHLRMVTDRARFDEDFMLRVSRKVCHDATIQIDNLLFETHPSLSGRRLELRYEPEWLSDPSCRLFLYEDGKRVGEAKPVRFHDNAHVKRKFPGNRKKYTGEKEAPSANAVSFCALAKGVDQDV